VDVEVVSVVVLHKNNVSFGHFSILPYSFIFFVLGTSTFKGTFHCLSFELEEELYFFMRVRFYNAKLNFAHCIVSN
jgi:hypothetical protein